MNKLKSIIKKVIPSSFLDRLLNIKERLSSTLVFNYDKKRFIKNYSASHKKASLNQIKTYLIFYTHSLEKGLSHDDFRNGFGKKALTALSTNLKVYEKNGFDKSDKVYVNAISTLKEYIKAHSSVGYDTDYLSKMFEHFLDEAKKCKKDIGGKMVINKSDKINNKLKNFKDLFTERYSVRSYSDDPVDIEDIKTAIDISMKTPSVCNRQSSRVHVITNKDVIKNAMAIQGGMNGYVIPPALIAVTTDSSSFISIYERNQIFIDGGAFSMSLLLSLEYQGLAACPLNTMFSIKRDKAMRKLLNIGSNENLIMIISVGNFKEKNNVAKSFRLSSKDITSIIE